MYKMFIDSSLRPVVLIAEFLVRAVLWQKESATIASTCIASKSGLGTRNNPKENVLCVDRTGVISWTVAKLYYELKYIIHSVCKLS